VGFVPAKSIALANDLWVLCKRGVCPRLRNPFGSNRLRNLITRAFRTNIPWWRNDLSTEVFLKSAHTGG
jgi:hypothetical protein